MSFEKEYSFKDWKDIAYLIRLYKKIEDCSLKDSYVLFNLNEIDVLKDSLEEIEEFPSELSKLLKFDNGFEDILKRAKEHLNGAIKLKGI